MQLMAIRIVQHANIHFAHFCTHELINFIGPSSIQCDVQHRTTQEGSRLYDILIWLCWLYSNLWRQTDCLLFQLINIIAPYRKHGLWHDVRDNTGEQAAQQNVECIESKPDSMMACTWARQVSYTLLDQAKLAWWLGFDVWTHSWSSMQPLCSLDQCQLPLQGCSWWTNSAWPIFLSIRRYPRRQNDLRKFAGVEHET